MIPREGGREYVIGTRHDYMPWIVFRDQELLTTRAMIVQFSVYSKVCLDLFIFLPSSKTKVNKMSKKK